MKRSPTPYLLAILALSIFLRIGVALYLGDIVDAPPLLTDQRSYDALGARLIAGEGFSFPRDWYPFTPADMPTAHWSFLYSLFVAGIYAVFGPHPLAVRIIQAVLGGILLPWLVYRLARAVWSPESGSPGVGESGSPESGVRSPESELPYSRAVPLLAALISAVYLYFVLYAATLMTETFFICAVLWSLERALALESRLIPHLPLSWPATDSRDRAEYAVSRGQERGPGGEAPLPLSWPATDSHDRAEYSASRGQERGPGGEALALGVALALATLFRQSILPWVAVLLAFLVWRAWRVGRLRAAVGAAAVVGVIIAAFIAPFTLRNYYAYHEFLLLNSNAGYAMYSAQHPLHGTNFSEFEAAPLPDGMWGRPEPELDRELMGMGIRFVLDDPGRYLLLSLSRLRAYFEFWPTPDTSLINNIGRTGSFGVFLPFMLLGFILALRQSGFARRNALILLFMAFYTVMHIFTWAMVRYRLPVDAVLVVFAAIGVGEVYRRIRRRVFATNLAN